MIMVIIIGLLEYDNYLSFKESNNRSNEFL